MKSGDENARAMGAKVIETIADDTFWDEVDLLLSITKPIFLMIKFADGEGPKMRDIYEKMDCMIGEIKDIMQNNKYANDYPKMEEITVARWEKMNIPLHCLGVHLTLIFMILVIFNRLLPAVCLGVHPIWIRRLSRECLKLLTKLVKMKVNENFYGSKCLPFKIRREYLGHLLLKMRLYP